MKKIALWLTALGSTMSALVVLVGLITNKIDTGLIFFALLSLWLGYVCKRIAEGTAFKSLQIWGMIVSLPMVALGIYLAFIVIFR